MLPNVSKITIWCPYSVLHLSAGQQKMPEHSTLNPINQMFQESINLQDEIPLTV